MIYVASLAGFCKKTFGDKVVQSKMSKIIEQLPINPDNTGMDSIILGPKDLSQLQIRETFQQALVNKHASIFVVYLYTLDKQANYIESNHIVTKKIERRITLKSFKNAVQNIYEERDLLKKDDIIKTEKPTDSLDVTEPTEPDSIIVLHRKSNLKESVIDDDNNSKSPINEEQVIKPITFPKAKSIEERIRACTEFSDWNLFEKLLKKETVIKNLMSQNSEYADTVHQLSKIDKKMVCIFKDDAKTAEQKFEAIKALGIERSGYKACLNSILSEKITSILTTISVSAESIIHSSLREITSSLEQYASAAKIYYKKDKEELDKLIEDRLHLQFELHELSKSLITLYESMDETVHDVIGALDAQVPSNNSYINEVYRSESSIFTPFNTTQLATKLMSDLQKNRISLSALEKNVQEIVTKVFLLCELDQTIITHQNKLIKLLEANNVEDVVIVDTILKNTLRLYIGPFNAGTRATSITWAGILSRRQNVLLIDLTGESKFRSYGIEPISLKHFISHRIEEPFLCVDGSNDGLDIIEDIIAELKTRLNYYPYINIIVDATQLSLIETLAKHALSITYITDCTSRSNALIRHAEQELTVDNIAKKIVFIDPIDEIYTIIKEMSMDPLTTKLIILPYLSKLKAYSIKAQPPFNDREIITIFEEAFR